MICQCQECPVTAKVSKSQLQLIVEQRVNMKFSQFKTIPLIIPSRIPLVDYRVIGNCSLPGDLVLGTGQCQGEQVGPEGNVMAILASQ